MNTRQLPILIILLLIAAASCNKSSNNTTPAPVSVTAQIATVRMVNNSNDTTAYTILYNAQGQVDSVVQTSSGYTQYTSFVYGNGYYTVTINSGGGPETEIITTNADGTVSSLVEDTFDTLAFSYNSNGIAQMIEENNYITNYVWVNGDIDSSYGFSGFSSGGSAILYYYDLTHLWQMGDIISIGDFLNYGRPTVRSKHLMTGRGETGSAEKYSYTFDAGSRIAQLSIPDERVIYYYTYTN